MRRSTLGAALPVASACLWACAGSVSSNDAGAGSPVIDIGAPPPRDGGDAPRVEDAEAPFDTGADSAEASAAATSRFASSVVSTTIGCGGGFGVEKLPGIVLGPPQGGGSGRGGLDVVTLGHGGEIVLSMAPNAIVDRPGTDFLVFENAFDVGGNPERPFAELGEVSVSEDGVGWMTFPCTATAFPYGACAGWHPVLASSSNGISPLDPPVAGGDPFDLHDLGITRARFVRIRDVGADACADGGGAPMTVGFDLDAIAIVNAELL